MRRDFSTGSLLRNPYQDEEDADPRVGLVNLADVMLVFACGLMLALVSYWNLDLPTITELDQADMQQVENIQEMTDAIQSSTSPYMELGKVYQDPKTGQMYIMTETEEEDSTDDATDSAAAEDTEASQDDSTNTQDSTASDASSGSGNAS